MIDSQLILNLLALDESDKEIVDVWLPIVLDFVMDRTKIKDIKKIPPRLYITISKMIEFHMSDCTVKRRKIKDVDIEFNTDYPSYIYKELSKFNKLQVV